MLDPCESRGHTQVFQTRLAQHVGELGQAGLLGPCLMELPSGRVLYLGSQWLLVKVAKEKLLSRSFG